MTIDEIAALLALCAAYDLRHVGETDIEAWEALVGDLAFADARAAILEHYRDSRERVMPADVRARVSTIRAARVADVDDVDLVRDIDPDDPQWRLVLQGRRRAVMDGVPLEQAKAIPAPAALRAIGTRP